MADFTLKEFDRMIEEKLSQKKTPQPTIMDKLKQIAQARKK